MTNNNQVVYLGSQVHGAMIERRAGHLVDYDPVIRVKVEMSDESVSQAILSALEGRSGEFTSLVEQSMGTRRAAAGDDAQLQEGHARWLRHVKARDREHSRADILIAVGLTITACAIAILVAGCSP